MVAFIGKKAAASQVVFTPHRDAGQDVLVNVCDYQAAPF